MHHSNPLGGGLSDLALLTNAQSRSLSPENRNGAPGGGALCPLEQGSAREAARELGAGWKVNPFVVIKAGTTYEIGDIEGPGTIDHIWMTPTGAWRDSILRSVSYTHLDVYKRQGKGVADSSASACMRMTE